MGSGTVTSSPTGINCGVDCTESYTYGTDVELTADPAPGWNFSGWSVDLSGSANPETITMNGSKNVTATFTGPVPNPPLGNTCGLDIVLVMDESASISTFEFNQMKAAFVGFVNALLPGTPTQFALVDFGTLAYLRQGFTSDAATIIAAINQPKQGGSAQYTNWQQGLIFAHNLFAGDRPDHPDLIIFASDGNPTAYGNPAITDMTCKPC